MSRVAVVVPTLGRRSLRPLLDALAGIDAPVLLVDDRPARDVPLLDPVPVGVRVVPGRAAGPAAARNLGWRAVEADWVAFLDDDVVPTPGWYAALIADLARCAPADGGSCGRIRVPRPAGRRPTDWERNVAGLEQARWATADLAYRRPVLAEVGGFDERFPRAYREDADLGLRVVAAGYRIRLGDRQVEHPVRPAGWTVSVRLQRGNADDALMRALHGRRWRAAAGVPRGRRGAHLLTTGLGVAGLAALLTGHRALAAGGLAAYAGGAAELAWRRIAPGPRSAVEVARMAVTSAVLPTAASWWWLQGWAALPFRLAAPGPRASPGRSPVAAAGG